VFYTLIIPALKGGVYRKNRINNPRLVCCSNRGEGGGMKRIYVLNDGILSLSMVVFYSANLK